MKNRLVGLDQHHLNLLQSISPFEYMKREELASHPHWTWLNDYLNDLIARKFITVSPSGGMYALTPDGRRLWNLSAQYNDEPDEEHFSRPNDPLDEVWYG